MRITTIQAQLRKLLKWKNVQAPIGSRAKAWWEGAGGEARKQIDLKILHIYRVVILVRNDPLFNYLSEFYPTIDAIR